LLAPPLLAAAPATQPAATAQDMLSNGPFAAGSVDLVLHDSKRDKDLNIKVRYPQGAKGPLPVVIFSHGLGGSGEGFAELTAHWASRGYVVILPTHSDSLALRKKAGQETPDLLAGPAALKSLLQPMDRLADVRFILDSFPAIEQRIDAPGQVAATRPVARLLDRDRIAMAGHSAGAFTTEMALGVKLTNPLTGRQLTFAEPRIKAGILVSGQGTATKTLAKDAWSDIALPMFVITGSLDTEPITDETPESRQEPFKFAKPGDKYLLFIDGATHGSYGGKVMSGVLLEKPTTDVKVITDAVSAGTTAFLDAYLKSDAPAKACLLTDAIPKSSGGKATLNHK